MRARRRKAGSGLPGEEMHGRHIRNGHPRRDVFFRKRAVQIGERSGIERRGYQLDAMKIEFHGMSLIELSRDPPINFFAILASTAQGSNRVEEWDRHNVSSISFHAGIIQGSA